MDGAPVQIGRKTTFMDTICRCNIDHHISKPYTPKENPAEGGIRELKRRYYRLIIKHGIPERLWDFVLDYVVDTMNVTVNYSKYSDGRVPLEIITGITPEITEYLDFTIYGWVFFCSDGGLGVNHIGRWLGVLHRVGPMMTYWVLPKSGIPISVDTVQMEDIPHQIIFDFDDEDDEFMRNFGMLINPETLEDGDFEGTEEAADDLDAQDYTNMEIGLRRGAEGELQRAKVKRRIVDENGRPIGVASSNQLLDTRQYEVEYADDGTEIFAANILAENLLAQVNEHGHKHRLMEEISDHRKNAKAITKSAGSMLLPSGRTRKRQTTAGWELHVIWKDGSSNWVTLKDMKESFPLEVADYAKLKAIEDEPAFAWWVPHVHKKRDRFISKVKSKYWERTHKYGIRIPKSVKEAIQIDQENGDTLWQDAIKMEMKNNQVAFEEFGGDIKKLIGYKRITGHMVFDVKLGENFRQKARYSADGHKTEAPAALTYSTVVARDSCYMIAGQEFGDEEGKTFIVRRALYGLKSAALAFRSHLAETLENLGFYSSYADPDVWMRAAIKPDGEEYYEYILCYVDDILCMSENAKDVMEQISYKFKFKKDKIEQPESYLGAGVKRKVLDGQHMWTMSSYDYVTAAVKNVKATLKDNQRWNLPKKAVTPMNSDYTPELDGSSELNAHDHTYFQELIGVLRWATEIGRVDILLEVSLLSQYQAGPREGHMEQLLRIFAYLDQHPKMTLYFDWRTQTQIFPESSHRTKSSVLYTEMLRNNCHRTCQTQEVGKWEAWHTLMPCMQQTRRLIDRIPAMSSS
ncbi:unnamed protein product [Cylindrotheca closterium]|uniref:Reverse transcriptase Ty1/copia-type domain-containing protein n=1 Tax=Cylindrotheca closterium TaxID=2856 RepID=A0AAD2G4F9_9STRA|nr:unnamed protein product [Cylindrotheca closterium]